MSLDNIKPLAIELGETVELLKHLTEKKKELEEQVRPVLMDRGAVQIGDYQFEVTLQAGRKTLDKKRLQEDGVNVDDYMKQGAPFTRMACKRVETL